MHFVKLRWLNSFSRQLMAASAGGVLFGALLLIAGLFAMRFFQGSLFSEMGVSEYVESIAEQLQCDATGRPVAVGPPQMSWLYESLGTEATYRVLDDKGAVVLSSEPGAAALTGTGEAAVLDFDNFTFERNGLVMQGATEPIPHAGRTWYVQFATSERLNEMLRTYVGAPLASRSVAILCLGSLVMYCLAMRFSLRAILKPLNQASAIAAKISPRNLGTRLQVKGVPEELRPLVENFNAALDRLEHNYRLQQEFLASAAHELKTPLALIRAQIEVGVDESSRDDLLQDVARMGRQVQQLLHLAEASESQNYTFTAVDPQSVAREVVSYIERLANQHGVTLNVVVEAGSTMLRADHGALFTLLKNLLENAIQHSRAGGVVQLLTQSNCISVTDEGAGVSPEDLPRLFTRFWRGLHRRDLGAGLGLSICREIATVHGWDLQARRGERGMIFDLRW
jgi:two-component system, OmpR family, sensor histidine kinase QseC